MPMNRSASVTWAALATILESLPPLGLGLFAVLDMFGVAPVRGRDPSVFLSGFEDLSLFVMVMTFGMLGLISAIGLLSVRRWARYTSIAFAIVTIVVMGLYLAIAIIAIAFAHKRNSLSIMSCWIGILTFYIGVSVWSLLLFNRPRIVQEFEGTAALFAILKTPSQGQ